MTPNVLQPSTARTWWPVVPARASVRVSTMLRPWACGMVRLLGGAETNAGRRPLFRPAERSLGDCPICTRTAVRCQVSFPRNVDNFLAADFRCGLSVLAARRVGPAGVRAVLPQPAAFGAAPERRRQQAKTKQNVQADTHD